MIVDVDVDVLLYLFIPCAVQGMYSGLLWRISTNDLKRSILVEHMIKYVLHFIRIHL